MSVWDMYIYIYIFMNKYIYIYIYSYYSTQMTWKYAYGWMGCCFFFFWGGGGGKKIQTTSGGTHGFTSLFQPLVLYPVDRRMVRDLRQGMEVCNLRKKWRVLFFFRETRG